MEQDRGFTLIEVLVAVAILAVIGILSLGSFSGILNAAEHVNLRTDNNNTARFIITRFATDIHSATLLPNNPNGLFVGENIIIRDSNEEISGDKITFSSFSRSDTFSNLMTDQAIVQWSVEPIEDSTEYLMRLYRSENIYITILDDDQSSRWEVTDRIKSFEIKYLDQGKKLYDQFDSKSSLTLPKGVELLFELVDIDGRVQKYSTFVLVGSGAI
ncbi:MAG: PulJ/GspJ family protein [Nitrospinota bacterium]